MRKFILTLSIFLFTLILAPAQVSAFTFPSFRFPMPSSRPFPTPKPLVSPTPSPSSTIIKEIEIDADYKKRINSVEIKFKNLEQIKFASILVTYTHNGINEGIVDSVFPSGIKKMKKDIFLGTCSTGICRPHLNPTKIKLKVDGWYTNNQSFSKTLDVK